MAKRCRACKGVYEPEQNGVTYFHVCPPLSVVEIEDAIDRGKIAVDLDRVRVAMRQPTQGPTEDAATFRSRVLAAYLAVHPVERRRKRNENPPSTRPDAAGTITDEGAGVDDVPSLTDAPLITAP